MISKLHCFVMAWYSPTSAMSYHKPYSLLCNLHDVFFLHDTAYNVLSSVHSPLVKASDFVPHLATVNVCTVPDNTNEPLNLNSSVTSSGELRAYHWSICTTLKDLWHVTAAVCLRFLLSVTVASYTLCCCLFSLLSGIGPMESFSGDTGESTEDIPGEVICHVVLHKSVMVMRKQVIDKNKLSK